MATEGRNNNLYFIIGALVVAVLVIFWLMSGGENDVAEGEGDTAIVVEEAPADGADSAVTTETAPATEPATGEAPAN